MPPLRNHMHEELASLTPILLVLFIHTFFWKITFFMYRSTQLSINSERGNIYLHPLLLCLCVCFPLLCCFTGEYRGKLGRRLALLLSNLEIVSYLWYQNLTVMCLLLSTNNVSIRQFINMLPYSAIIMLYLQTDVLVWTNPMHLLVNSFILKYVHGGQPEPLDV